MSTSRPTVPGLLAMVALAFFATACSTPEPTPPPDDTCPAEQTSCSGICRDLRTDANHCGACGNACAAGSTCTAGQCVAPQPQAGCGNGRVEEGEACDDGNLRSDDGCSAACVLESGYTCSGTPSTCAARCGDGVRAGSEACDDGNTATGDGCGAACAVESGYACSGSPSTCTIPCGDGVRAGSEACDDGNTAAGDGCTAACAVEPGYSCSGTPSVCAAGCGDGLKVGSEGCDDSNTVAGDGCSATCAVESGYECTGTAPSVCATRCGDGRVRGTEVCDDGNTTAGDGCSATCELEPKTETEPNETHETANVLGAVPVRVLGGLASDEDVDMFRFTLTTVTDLRIVTDDGQGPQSCQGIDTYVELLDEEGTRLVGDDDSGVSFCSLLDPSMDPQVVRLRPGTYHVAVSSAGFGGAASLPYGLNILPVATCGNGDREGSETCDDGNTAGGDTCNRFCQVPPTPEQEPNDTPATASGPLMPDVFSGGAIASGADRDLYRFTLTATSDVTVEVFDESGAPSCRGDIDPYVEVLNASGTRVAYNDDAGPEWCPLLSVAAGDRGVRRLAPGTWYVRVGSTSGAAIPGYTVRLRLESVCGDGRVSGSEECDGTSQCSSTCERVPVCGDGFLDAPEACDDGNTVNGDGCNATCAVEGTSGGEAEPNATPADADARATGGSPVRITGSSRLAGRFSSVEDVDVYRVEVSAPTVVRFETFHGGLQKCEPDGANGMRLISAAGATLVSGTADGIGTCSALQYHLTAGVHYVEVAPQQAAETPLAYVLETSFLASSGAEAEPNEARANATPLNLTNGEGFITASHPTAADVDTFRITIPAGGRSLRAELTEGSTEESCESNGIDSRLVLLDSNGATLVSDDDGGRGYCSRIDGMGTQPDNASARNLPAGTYYLQVTASSTTSGERALFDYRLSVQLR